MHYFIDGYNMLFRLKDHEKDFQTQREQIINLINQKATILQLNVTLVFDATFQVGGLSRAHFGQLEITFTNEGETADEFILDEVRKASNPRQEVVVTSDKRLAAHIRHCGAQTQGIDEFLRWLHKAYTNRLKKTKLKPEPSPKKIQKAPENVKELPSKQDTLEECLSYYEKVFEAEFEEIVKAEETRKERLRPTKTKKRVKKPKDPYEKLISDEERWLKIFEERLRTKDN